MMAGIPELIIILVILAVFFGAGRMPDVMGALGSTAKNFRAGVDEYNADHTAPEDPNDRPGPQNGA